MKIEMDTDGMITFLITVVLLCLTVVTIEGCRNSAQVDQEAIRAGLQQQYSPGSGGTRWVK